MMQRYQHLYFQTKTTYNLQAYNEHIFFFNLFPFIACEWNQHLTILSSMASYHIKYTTFPIQQMISLPSYFLQLFFFTFKIIILAPNNKMILLQHICHPQSSFSSIITDLGEPIEEKNTQPKFGSKCDKQIKELWIHIKLARCLDQDYLLQIQC